MNAVNRTRMLVLAVLLVYLFLALRRAYGLRPIGSSWRAAALLFVYAAVFRIGLSALLLLTMGL